MKTSVPRFLRGRLAQAGGLLAVIAVVVTSIAWSGPHEGSIKLEGAWVATVAENGVLGLLTMAPDPSGRTTTWRNQMVLPPEFVAYVQGLVPGFTGFTDEIGETMMTGPNTATYTARWYYLVGGYPALVALDNASVTCTSPVQMSIVHEIAAYFADADGQPVGDPVFPAATYHSTSRRITQ
jgi:hypothetical protein